MEPMPTEVARGDAVTFTGQNFPSNREDITIFLNGDRKELALLVSPDKTKFIFAVPSDLPLGRYRVRVEFKMNGKDVPFAAAMPPDAMLTVFSDSGKSELKITAVSPLVSYPKPLESDPKKDVYGFQVIGDGFSVKPADNFLIVNQAEVAVCWEPYKDCKPEQPQGKVVSRHQLEFANWNIPALNRGVGKMQIRVGQTYSEPFDFTLSPVDSGLPKWLSIGAVVALFAIVLLMLSRGYRNIVEGRKYSILSALFLDAETDTYSLSRLQFFIWTAVGMVGYLYLLLSRSLVQGKLEFVDVPAGLPGIIMIAAGTTVLAQGITKSKGPKGSGEVHPSLSDLISTGGVVVPERFQFFVWTIIGAAVFVYLVFQHDPGTIKDLPQVPSGFLELMGVSSLGYLGGKVARRAGPVIDEILTKPSSLEFTLKGRNLSKDASFRIGDEDVRSDLILNKKPEITDPDTEGEPNTGKSLKFTIAAPKPQWLKDNNLLTIINPDGQKATLAYDVGPVVLDLLLPASVADDKTVKIVVKGLNLSSKSKVSIEGPRGAARKTLKVQFIEPDTLEITTTLPKGTVVITNPDQRIIRRLYDMNPQQLGEIRFTDVPLDTNAQPD
jgi:hypothetical protein